MSLLRTFSTLGCPAFTLDAALALAARYGLGGVELRALGGTVELPRYLALEYGSPAALADKMRGSPVRIVSLDTSLHVIGATKEEREQLDEFVPWAEALGVRWLRVFDGGKSANDAELAEAADVFGRWRERRRQHGWAVDWMVETHDSLFTSGAIASFVRAVPGVAILWDSHHTWKKGGEDPVATWQAIHGHVVHVHVKDSISLPSGRHPFTYVLPGQGEFPAQPLFSRLREGFTGPVSLQWELLWHPTLAPLEEALQVAQENAWW